MNARMVTEMNGSCSDDENEIAKRKVNEKQ